MSPLSDNHSLIVVRYWAEAFDPVAERIRGVEPLETSQWFIFDDCNSGMDKAFPHLNEIGELECDVGFGGGSERPVDSEVELEIPGLKPDASTSTENLWLLDLVKSEERTAYKPCTCPAYAWPHKPGGGGCGWPGPPKYRHLVSAGTKSNR